jgi:hypothetical protein
MQVSFRRASRAAGGLALLFAVLFPSGCERNAAGNGAASDVAATEGLTLSATFASPEGLARAVLLGIEKEDVETLKRLPLTKDEFRLYVWPSLPSSRPERNVPFEYVWGDLHQKSIASIARNFDRFKGRKLELLAVRFQDGTTDYGTFRVHRDARVRVRDAATGEEGWLDLFGSVMEWQGKYKLFSYVTD